ncbi:MAG: hypothetical protein M3R60_15840, partial [Pseudomonadota bacterium]|nr:hypothetical protein [Pseudomonadota bacterium]
HTLDANGMEFTSEPIVAAAAPVEEEQRFDLAFDMDFDAPTAATPVEEPKSLDDIRLDSAESVAAPEFNMADLSHDFDLPTLPETKEPVSYASTDPLADLDAMNFDLPTTPVAGAAVPADDPFALPDLDAETPAEVPNYAAPANFAAAPTYAAPQFDMSNIDLDLPSGEPESHQAEEMAMAPSGGAEMSASHMEMETKLDLAIAYQEIGDKEGARELLDEVIKGGNHEQVGKANDMRSKLA